MSAPPSSIASAPTAPSLMLAIPEKNPTPLDLHRPLRHYISSHYSSIEAQNLDDDLHSLQTMRSDLEKPLTSLPSRRDLLASYFRALTAVQARFPITSIAFTWHDAFRPSKKASLSDIHLEKAAVLFNLAAVHSQIAVAADRNDGAGIKLAHGAFQLSAGAFAFLKDNEAVKAGAATVDVSVECAGTMERLMIAQAQECMFEKAVAEQKMAGTCSKIARQAALYYEEVYASLNAPPLNQHFDKAWICHAQLKAAQYNAEACYRAALDLHEHEEIDIEIARLKAGVSILADAKKSSKGAAATLLEAVNKLENSMNRNLEKALKENNRVYLMRVPDPDSLAPLQGAILAKPTAMDEIFDATKEKLFSSLVPDSSAKALSRYTEMVDSIIRIQAEQLQQGSEIARVRLKEMDLPDSILALEGNFSLPVDLKEDVEAVQVVGGPSGLEAELQQLRDLRGLNQELLVETEELLQKEEREDAQFRTQFGTRWTRPQSSTLTKSLQDRLNRFAANIKQAAENDARIERAVKDNAPLMAILDHRPIESALPSLGRPIMSLDGNEDAAVGALKQSLRQLEALGAQRAGLEDMLKEMRRQDDILPKLMATTGSHEDLFRKEISKYDNICEEILNNIQTQDQLLLQIQAQNEHFAAIFNVEDYKVAREKSYRQISAAIAKFREIKDSINEGLKFYATLQDAITNMKQQCSDFVMTRNMQCRDMIEDVQRQLSGLSLDAKAGYNHPSAGTPNPHQSSSIPQQSDPRHSPYPSSSPPPHNQHPPAEQPRPVSHSSSSVPPPPYQQPPMEQSRPIPYPSSSPPPPSYQHPPAEHSRPVPYPSASPSPYQQPPAEQSRPVPYPSPSPPPPYQQLPAEHSRPVPYPSASPSPYHQPPAEQPKPVPYPSPSPPPPYQQPPAEQPRPVLYPSASPSPYQQPSYSSPLPSHPYQQPPAEQPRPIPYPSSSAPPPYQQPSTEQLRPVTYHSPPPPSPYQQLPVEQLRPVSYPPRSSLTPYQQPYAEQQRPVPYPSPSPQPSYQKPLTEQPRHPPYQQQSPYQQQPSYQQPSTEQPRPVSYTSPSAQLPYQQPPSEQPRQYSQTYSPYAVQRPPYQAPPAAGPYHPSQQVTNHDYGQPSYPGWRGPYNTQPQQQHPDYFPRPQYSAPGSYAPQSGGYYGQR